MAELPQIARVGAENDASVEPPPLERIHDLKRSIEGVILGKPDAVESALVSLFAGGHLLIEDVPGVGKTMLAQALARSLNASFRRIQFTSDLLPADILGVSVLKPESGSFEFRRGPIFAQVVLADEINRATPKTQSAMLEAMNESQVSVDSGSYPLPRPFVVIATQNPAEHRGTYPLPESQLDRFLMRIRIGYPSAKAEKALLEVQQVEHPIDAVEPVMTVDDVFALQQAVRRVDVDAGLTDYIVQLASVTRSSEKLSLGVSPRGTLLLQRASQARALIGGRTFVIPDDVKSVAVAVLSHRVVARVPTDTEPIIAELVDSVKVPL